ncbi:MAG: hypothetical protein APR63_07880 [Desulfuromonas sp. SDB]|nr:MAG: hypothetical protein APR63_07880 [Desulfuromonas sp. SDB]
MSVTYSRINQIFISRLRRLEESIRESSNIVHDATKGALREAYLRDFLNDIMPPNLSIGSGFICDCFGTISPQIDFILAEKNQIPSIALMENIALIPVETALLAIEMKSIIKSNTKDQLQKQYDEFNKMKPVVVVQPGEEIEQTNNFPILLSLIALESEVKKETLVEWFKSIPTLLNICIIGKYSIKIKKYGISDCEIIKGANYIETLNYFSVVINNCYDNLEKRRKLTYGRGFGRSWIPYIVGHQNV